jgi:uncharacterized membrane protein (UPF0127 family)
MEKNKKITLKFNGRKKSIFVKKVSEFGKVSGLMFRLSTTSPLLFCFKDRTRMAIHSFFVFFPFLAIWFDKDFNVLEWKIINPWSVHIKPRKEYFYLIEVPFNAKYAEIIDFFVGKREKFKY